MKFGPVPLGEASGAVLAHSVRAGDLRIRKGTLLTEAVLADLSKAGLTEVVVAALEPGDMAEDAAATTLAAGFAGRADMHVTDAFTGRVNLIADVPGVLEVDPAAVLAFNSVDAGITIATLADKARVGAGSMLATIKVIPYGVSAAAVAEAAAHLGPESLHVAERKIRSAVLVMTETEAISAKALAKGEAVVQARLAALGVEVRQVVTVAHAEADLAEVLRRAGAVGGSPTLPAGTEIVLILGASATSDVRDVCPAALVAAGGEMLRFGMPVDPGNLLFIGQMGAVPVVGLPGCARSPALNGADWVLERLVSGLDVGDAEIAAMGVGGLLKEIPIRPQPRRGKGNAKATSRVAVILLAAGQSRRMKGVDKLLEPVDGAALLRRSAEVALASRAGDVFVVLPPDGAARAEVLTGLDVALVTAEQAAEGMAASLRAGLAAVPDGVDAVIVALADMPEMQAAGLDALIAGFAPDAGVEICRAVTPEGRAGHPVLFGRRFFESLGALEGDQGARRVVAEAADFVKDIPFAGDAAVLDLDTPEQWAAYRARG